MAATFASTYKQFISELKLTFPEFLAQLCLAESNAAGASAGGKAEFGALWMPHSSAVAAQDASIFTASGIPLVPGVVMTAALWAELSPATQSATWKYLSSLLLLYTAEEDAGLATDLSGFKADLEAMMKRLSESKDVSGASAMPEGFAALFAKLASSMGGGAAGGAAGLGGAGLGGAGLGGAAGAAAPPFKIPERLFKGHIAKIAEELVREFKPEEFGIDPAMLESKDPAHVFAYLQEVFTKRPEVMMTAAQKIGKRLQAKFAKGEINRDEIIREAEELMKEFSDNEAFSSMFGSLGELFKSGEKESGNEGSARRREVQERLRKKAAAKKEAAAAFPIPTTNVVFNAAATAAAAAAAAAAETSLLEEEDVKSIAVRGGQKKSGKK